MCHVVFFQGEKKGNGNAVVADLLRHRLPLHRRHLHHLRPPPLLRQTHHTHLVVVGVAPEVVVSVFLMASLQPLSMNAQLISFVFMDICCVCV